MTTCYLLDEKDLYRQAQWPVGKLGEILVWWQKILDFQKQDSYRNHKIMFDVYDRILTELRISH